jgi:hypothetical protein
MYIVRYTGLDEAPAPASNPDSGDVRRIARVGRRLCYFILFALLARS